MNPSVTALVVTYNRKELLCQCVDALANQTRKPNRILVVDNASTDGTSDAMDAASTLYKDLLEYLRLPENSGGAGGFAAGLRHAVESGAQWTWIMDDDAIPRPDALEVLLDRSLNSANLYGSAALSGDQLAWPMQKIGKNDSLHRITGVSDLAAETEVRFLPFLGLLVSASTVKQIGVPDAGFFLAADDVDYCLRARRAGARVVLVRDSRIDHPPSKSRSTLFLGWRVDTLELPPWKRYYDIRNRILVAKKHHGFALLYATLPGTLIRAMVTLTYAPDRRSQLRACWGGTVDGLLGRKGQRHQAWGLG